MRRAAWGWTAGLVAALGVLGAAPAADAPMVAVVTAVQGEAHRVTPDGQQVRVHPLTRLAEHDKLVMDEGSTLTTVFPDSGRHVTLQGATTAEMTSDGTTSTHQQVDAGRPYPSLLVGPGVRFGAQPDGAAPLLGFTHFPASLHFEFLNAPDVRSYDVKIRHGAEETILNIPFSHGVLELGAETLQRYNQGPGAPLSLVTQRPYLVDIVAHHAQGDPTGATFQVYVLSKGERDTLLRAVSEAQRDTNTHPDDPTSFALLGARYENSQCYLPGIQALGELAHLCPDQADYIEQLRDGLEYDVQEVDSLALRAHDRGAYDGAPAAPTSK